MASEKAAKNHIENIFLLLSDAHNDISKELPEDWKKIIQSKPQAKDELGRLVEVEEEMRKKISDELNTKLDEIIKLEQEDQRLNEEIDEYSKENVERVKSNFINMLKVLNDRHK